MKPVILPVGENKLDVYEDAYHQIDALITDEPDRIANLSNFVSVLKYSLRYVSWVGFYLLHGEELVLGPFQGKPACVRIKLGKGVCGAAASGRQTILVPNVAEFPGHIVCDADARSEIVVPVYARGIVCGVLDVDSTELNAFDSTDKLNLERLAELVSNKVFSVS